MIRLVIESLKCFNFYGDFWLVKLEKKHNKAISKLKNNHYIFICIIIYKFSFQTESGAFWDYLRQFRFLSLEAIDTENQRKALSLPNNETEMLITYCFCVNSAASGRISISAFNPLMALKMFRGVSLYSIRKNI